MSMLRDELKTKIAELKNLKNMKSELEDMISDLECEIKSEMTERQVDELILDEFKVTWRATTRTSIDSASLQKTLPDIAARFMRTTQSRRFVVS